MSVRVRLPALFADRIDGVSTVDIPADTVQDALRAITTHHPELRTLVLGPNGEINPMTMVFLNNEQLSSGQLTSSVGDGDEIEVIPAIDGGALRHDRSTSWHTPYRPTTSISSSAPNRSEWSWSIAAQRSRVSTVGLTKLSCETTPLVTT